VDLSSVDRILAKVGHHPPDLDRAALAQRLSGINANYRAARDVRTTPKKRQERNAKAIKMAKALMGLVAEIMEERQAFEPAQPHFANLQHLLSWLGVVTGTKDGEVGKEVARVDPAPVLTELAESDLSANEQLVSLLSRVYEDFFHEEAGFTHSDVTESDTGPFIDFAEAGLAELGVVNFSRASIARALTEARGKRRRNR
jgi:hypothetical protein